MYQSRSFLSAFLFVFTLFSASAIASAQTESKSQPERDFEVVLHVLVGSNDGSSGQNLPANLTAVSRQLRSNFAFTGLRVANTFVGRISSNGNFEYKSVTNELGFDAEGAQSFLEWSIGNLHAASTGLQANSFRFGARIPVKTSSLRDDSGKAAPVFSYESIGLSLTRIGIPENAPTLLGSLSLPKANGTLFLVMTVTPTKQ